MKVILTTNIKKLGKVGDQVVVKEGFARNYLFPNKMALRDSKTNLEYYDKIKDEVEKKENEKKENTINLLNSIKKIKVEFTKEADEKDQLYGAINKKEIINFFNQHDIKILSDDIKIPQTIRTLGDHSIEINPYEGIIEEVKVFVKKT